MLANRRAAITGGGRAVDDGFGRLPVERGTERRLELLEGDPCGLFWITLLRLRAGRLLLCEELSRENDSESVES